jgi:hypothetical protein
VGGVIIYFRNDIKTINLTDEDNVNVDHLWVKIINNNSNLMLGLFYRPPNSSKEENNFLIQKLKKYPTHNVAIFGDFNYGSINWSTGNYDSNDRKFYECVNDLFLKQMVTECTREDSILDLVFTNDKKLIEDVVVAAPVGSSDHNVINCNINFSIKNLVKQVSVYNYNLGNYNEIISQLSDECWDTNFAGLSANEMWIVLRDKLLLLREKYVKKSCPKQRSGAPWLNNELKKLIKKKQNHWKKYRNSKDYKSKIKFQKTRNQVSKEIRKAKMNFETKLVKRTKKK